MFPFRYSSPAPRVGPRAKYTSWRSTNPGWPTGRGRHYCPRLEKVQYMRKWPKSDPSCSGLESGHLIFCPRISFKGLGSTLGSGDPWPLVNYCDRWSQATVKTPQSSACKVCRWILGENIVLRSILSLIFLLARCWPLQGSKPTWDAQNVFTSWEGDDEGITEEKMQFCRKQHL